MIEIIECSVGAIEQPWLRTPRQLTNWWEMEQFSARGFFLAGCQIESVRADCLESSLVVSADERIYNLAAPLDERLRERAGETLDSIEAGCRSIGLRISADTAKELAEHVRVELALHNYQWLRDQMLGIRKLIEKEMKDSAFFYISPERGKFWPKLDERSIFGDGVADSFPSAHHDIGQAGICLAIGLGTATVFHLMRVAEIGLCALGSEFGVSLAHTNWEPAIREIENRIREMHKDPKWKSLSDCKSRQESYAQIASHFGILKDAWRNYTMHVRGKYTEDEAEQMFRNIKGFMQKLAAIGLKEIYDEAKP